MSSKEKKSAGETTDVEIVKPKAYKKDAEGRLRIPKVDIIGLEKCPHLKTGKVYSVTKETAEVLVDKGSAKYKGSKEAVVPREAE